MSPPEFAFARICFTLATVILLTRAAWWLAFEQSLSKTGLALSAFIILGAIGALWSLSMQWVNERHESSRSIEKKPIETAAPSQKATPQEQKITETPQTKPDIIRESRFPFIDIELVHATANEYAYDVYVHNKSDVALTNISISRAINPEKNRQKMALRNGMSKLRPFQKQLSVLAAGEKKKIYREHIPSWEYMVFIVHYRDDSNKQYRCVFEGDHDGLRLTDNSRMPKKTPAAKDKLPFK